MQKTIPSPTRYGRSYRTEQSYHRPWPSRPTYPADPAANRRCHTTVTSPSGCTRPAAPAPVTIILIIVVAINTGIATSSSSPPLAELIWVRPALEQQHPEIPEAKRMCALLALVARGLRSRYAGALEAELRGPFAHGRRNALQRHLTDGGVLLTETHAFYVAQAKRFGRIAALVDAIAATHAAPVPDGQPAAPRRRPHPAVGARSDELVARAARLADSLPVVRPVAENDAVAVGPGDEQVRLIRGMERVVDDVAGLVAGLREVVARAETSPLGLQEEYEAAPRKIFGGSSEVRNLLTW
ncbi:uncharacterized protein PG986_012543 [Apiospora aurea]|uniref:Uncharacterized protein n=1 Tax=Apiospora aurea TaxID=335848 RepID=A0ABR1Q0I4_9PEZI